MTDPVLADALAESCLQVPDTLAAVCVDLDGGKVLASHVARKSDEPATELSRLADAAARVFAGGRKAGLNRLWTGLGYNAEGGDEVVLLEPERCLVFLRPASHPRHAVVFLTGRAANIGLIIARTRAVTARFEETLRRLASS